MANLVKIIEKNKNTENIKTRIVGGSIPPRGAKVWTEWEKCNYNCLLGERSANNKVLTKTFIYTFLFYFRKYF